MLAFSTCWNSQKHTDGYAMVEEIISIGFTTIEISHGLKVSLLPGIIKAFEENLISVCGVHNFCPSPVEVMMDAPDCYEFTSHREHERKRAIDLTIRTIETAAKFKANYVVLHLGSVPMRKISPKLEKLIIHGNEDSKKFAKLKNKLIKKRSQLSPLYLERAKDSIKKIIGKAEEHNVKLAIESRSAYEDVPNETEMIDLMKEYENNPLVGYWHDFGHVHRKHNLGLLNHYEWLKTMHPFIIGGHLHDVKWPHRDHHVPFSGQINFEDLMKNFHSTSPIVLELSSRRPTEDIKKSMENWNNKDFEYAQ